MEPSLGFDVSLLRQIHHLSGNRGRIFLSFARGLLCLESNPWNGEKVKMDMNLTLG